jgi:hypothetical protein
LELEARSAIQVHRDQVQADSRHFKGQALDGFAITACQQRGFPPRFRKVVDR